MLASLVLSDARLPGGGHVHSGGLEEAAERFERGIALTVGISAGIGTRADG